MANSQTTIFFVLGTTLFCFWLVSDSPKLNLYPKSIRVKTSPQNETLFLNDFEVKESSSGIEKSKVDITSSTISTNGRPIHSRLPSSSSHPSSAPSPLPPRAPSPLPSPMVFPENSSTVDESFANVSISDIEKTNLSEIDVTILRYNEHKANDCFRRCSNNMSNKIYYGCAVPNGLIDREEIFTGLANLAGYLCATVELPKPAIMLHPKHNHNQTVSETLTWDDFFQYSFNDNFYNHFQTQQQMPQQQENQTVVPLPPVIQDVDVMDYPRGFKKSISCRNPKEIVTPASNYNSKSKQSIEIVTSYQQDTFNDDFDTVRRLSLKFNHNTSFTWTIAVNWYRIGRSLDEHLRQLQLDAPTKQLHLPCTSCSYSSVRQPIKVQTVINTLWDMMIQDYSSTLLESNAGDYSIQNHSNDADVKIGFFHLRRGDTKGTCDTTLTRMDSYINCTFSKENLARNDNRHQFYKISGIDSSSTTTPLLLLLGTDETDPDYINGIEQFFVQHHPHLKMIHADAIVQKYLREESSSEPDSPIPSSYLNNYHVFTILEGFMAKSDFVVQERRSHCKDCDKIQWKQPKEGGR